MSKFIFLYITSYSRLVGSGLKSIFHSKARFEINERSWVRSLAQSFLFLTILKIDVLFANSFMLLFNRSGSTYIKKEHVLIWTLEVRQPEFVSMARFVHLKQIFQICERGNVQLIYKVCVIIQ